MKKLIAVIVIGFAAASLAIAALEAEKSEPAVNKFQISYWDMTKTYEAKGKFQDGSTFNLTSDEDLTYSQWREKIEIAWQASQEPPEPPVLYETDDYAIRDPNDGGLVLEWKADDVKITVTKKTLPALADAVKKIGELMP